MVWDAKKILHQKGAQKWSQLSYSEFSLSG